MLRTIPIPGVVRVVLITPFLLLCDDDDDDGDDDGHDDDDEDVWCWMCQSVLQIHTGAGMC